MPIDHLSVKKYRRWKDPETGRWMTGSEEPVSVELRGLPLEERIRLVARELGITQKALRDRHAHLNPGMRAMALTNLLRFHRRRKVLTNHEL